MASVEDSADGDDAVTDEEAVVAASLPEGVTLDAAADDEAMVDDSTEAAGARVSTVKELPIDTSTATPGAEVGFLASSAPSSHPCHQESFANTSGDNGESSHAEKAGCNSCTLCMAFGLPVFFSPKLGQGDFTQRFFVSLKTFQSQDLASLNKPPIL